MTLYHSIILFFLYLDPLAGLFCVERIALIVEFTILVYLY